MFVIMTGSSGVGKNTVINELKKINKKFVLMPTYTTREMREGEIEGNPYFFLTKEEFQEKIHNKQLLEHEFIHNNYYGSSLELLEKYLKTGKIVTKDIGVQGAQNLYKKLSDKTQVIRIFLTVNSKKELKKRLRGRNEKNIKLRLKRYKYEQKQIYNFDYIIYNKNLKVTTDAILKIVKLKSSDFLPCKKVNNLNSYKIKLYINKLKSGKILKPIKISLYENKAYIVKGAEKYVASLISGIPVGKVLVDKIIKKKQEIRSNWYENLI